MIDTLKTFATSVLGFTLVSALELYREYNPTLIDFTRLLIGVLTIIYLSLKISNQWHEKRIRKNQLQKKQLQKENQFTKSKEVGE